MATYTGTDGSNTLKGGDGADTITGGRGYDQMSGGAGADVFVFSIGDGGGLPHDAITDFQVGVDKLLLPAGATLHTEDDAGGQWVHYGADLGNNDWIQLIGVHGATLAQLTGAGAPPSSSGPTTGNDTLTGTSGADAINALAGNDVINGGDGADTISGSFGYDQMTGGAGADVFAFSYSDGGNFPHDVITDFQIGVDKLVFPTGVLLHTENDTGGQWVHYGADLGSNNWVQLLGVHGAALGQLTGLGGASPSPTAGDDTLSGTSGADGIFALAGNDSVSGGGGTDTLDGGEGSDMLAGEAGNDRLYGRFGSDTLAGGEGNDTFVFGSILEFQSGTSSAYRAGVTDTGFGQGARDTIVDFQGAGALGGDTIDLSTINFFARHAPTDIAFQFIGTANFSGPGPQVRYEAHNDYTLIQMDGVRTQSNPTPSTLSPDGTPDAEIVVVGQHVFTAGDFIL